jgi:hypothetical protein
MSTVTVPRSDVTIEEVSAVLRDKLGSRYRITPAKETGPADANTIQVRRNWLTRAKVRIRSGAESTELQVSPDFAVGVPGTILNGFFFARKVSHVLEHAQGLVGAN